MTEQGPSIPRALVRSPLAQFILFAFTVIYVLSPVDAIPDIMPIIGWLDDLAVFVTQIAAFVMYVREKRRQFAEKAQSRNDAGGNHGR